LIEQEWLNVTILQVRTCGPVIAGLLTLLKAYTGTAQWRSALMERICINYGQRRTLQGWRRNKLLRKPKQCMVNRENNNAHQETGTKYPDRRVLHVSQSRLDF